MAKISRQTKEILQIVVFVVVVVVLVLAYIVHPLGKVNKTLGRIDLDTYNVDSLEINDPALFIEAGLPADSFMFEADAQVTLACLTIPHDSAIGTLVLLHKDGENRDSLLQMAVELYQQGYSIFLYDQRASKRTTGKYRGDGSQESIDLATLISTLEIREQITHPLYIIGFETGADAALLASIEETRIEGVIAINPHLTTSRMHQRLKAKHDVMWIPLYNTMMGWWYKMRSGYAGITRDLDDLQSVACNTLLIVEADDIDDDEVQQLIDLSVKEKLIVEPADKNQRNTLINSFLSKK